MASLETLKGQIELVLANYPETRDSDVELTIRVWKSFYQEFLFNGDQCVYLKDLFELPREDNIKRIRATIQNCEGRYLPTSWEVAKKRGIEENKWRSFIGYPVGNPNQTSMQV